MKNMTRIAACAVVSTLGAGPLATLAVGANSVQQSCSKKTNDSYGFQCQGYSNVGAGLEPVTFVGTVAGSETGVFDGYGTFSSSLGSSRQHAVGQGVFQDKTCFGHIQYHIKLVLPDGSEVDVGIPPLDIDFTVVNGGFEILGTPVALPGVTGAFVPRMSCRLVKIKAQD
jgi:hypothetical protein